MKDEFQIKVVRKGERVQMPLNHSGYQWATIEPEKNGIVISVGSTGAFGIFINEDKLRDIIAKFVAEIGKEIEE